MNDLSSVDWVALQPPSTSQQRPPGSGNYLPTLRPTLPLSGTSTPLQPSGGYQKPANSAISRSNSSTPANDSFANLVAFGGQQVSKSPSLQEQQVKLQKERAKREAEKARQFDSHFGGHTASWVKLGDGRTTPNRVTAPPTYAATDEYGGQKLSKVINKPFAGIPTVPRSPPQKPLPDEEEDLLAAFNAAAPVDKSSHMPSLAKSANSDEGETRNGMHTEKSSSHFNAMNSTNGDLTHGQDDDPFGLGMSGYKKSSANTVVSNGASQEDDDVLGLLGRPVSEFSQKTTSEDAVSARPSEAQENPQSLAVAELVEMGFTPENSRRALESTESGADVQAAVGWLLNQAHKKSSQKSQKPHHRESGNDGSARAQLSKRTPGRRKSSGSAAAKPAWMRAQDPAKTSDGLQDSRSPTNGEKDSSQYAAEIGNKMFKTANSLWKTGAKRINQAVSELNSDSDSSQPKWMRNPPVEHGDRKNWTQQREDDVNDHDAAKSHKQPSASDVVPDVTDEALMLEADTRPPPRKPRPKPEQSHNISSRQPPIFDAKLQEKSPPQPKFIQQTKSYDLSAKLNRQATEEQTSKVYISPARRKKPTPKSTPAEPISAVEPSVLPSNFQSSPQRPATSQSKPPAQQPAPQKSSLPARPTLPKRSVPPVSPFVVQSSTSSRQAGTSAFKRGDYALATTNYTAALSALPSAHPLCLPLLTNRALTHLKTGDPKASVVDATAALTLIGPPRGTGEIVDLGGNEGVKQMSEYWGKAMTRQAEALEQLERWPEAASVWKTCVEAGVGGATSIAGRSRCEKATVGPTRPKSSFMPKRAAPKPRPNASALSDLAPNSAQSAEAVSRLRAANAAADRLDDEKFRLADQVDSRISHWRAGKEGNLRALLSTLENVLWEGSGWKKVGMAELLLPGKVKIIYMKGIGKVHPDKVGQPHVSRSPNLCPKRSCTLMIILENSCLRQPRQSRKWSARRFLLLSMKLGKGSSWKTGYD